MQVHNESAVSFPVAFDETIYPPSTKYWFFFIHCHRGSGDIMVSARLDDYPNTVERYITVWNLSAGGVVTSPTSRYSCIACLRVTVSGILSVGLWTRIRVLTQHTRMHYCQIRIAVDYRDMIDTWTITNSRSSFECLLMFECLRSELFIF